MPESTNRIESHSQRKTVVVFHKSDGKIAHIHEAIALSGATLPPDSQLEADAMEIARRHSGREAGELAFLHVSRDDLKSGLEYRVDMKKLVLVETTQKRK